MSTWKDGRPPHGAADEDDRLPAELGAMLRTLGQLPPVPPGATDRVLAATVARGHRSPVARVVDRSSGALHRPGAGWRWRIAAGLLLAAGLGGIGGLAVGRDRTPAGGGAGSAPETVALGGLPRAAVEGAAGDAAAGTAERGSPFAAGDSLIPAAGGDVGGSDAPVPTPFVLRRPEARRVAVVGDFNGWDPDATPLVRGLDGTWTASVPLLPGRHGYAFVIDGTTWLPDPRLPVTRDADYGRDHSVVVVGTP